MLEHETTRLPTRAGETAQPSGACMRATRRWSTTPMARCTRTRLQTGGGECIRAAGTLTTPSTERGKKPYFHSSALASSSAPSNQRNDGESLDYFRRDGCVPSRAAAARASMVLIPGFRSRGLDSILETRISSFHPTLEESDRDGVDCAIWDLATETGSARHRGRMYPPETSHP